MATIEEKLKALEKEMVYYQWSNRLIINYTSGMPTIPESIKRAIFIKVGEMFDVDRNGYVSNQIQRSNAFDRMLSPYTNSLY